MIRRKFADWQLWMRGQIVELETYTRLLHDTADTARDTDKALKAVLYKVLARYIVAYTEELREKLRAGTRKHDEREHKHTCEECGETVETLWIDKDGTRLCTICAMEKCNTAYATPHCAYCGQAIEQRTSFNSCCDGDNFFCDEDCALRYHEFARDGE